MSYVTEMAGACSACGPTASEWFAFRVRPRHEKQVALTLREKGFASFLPLSRSRRRWSDRTTVVEMPLFPGYIFCFTARSSMVRVLITGGVIDVVRAGASPLAAEPAEIEALQKSMALNLALDVWPYAAVRESALFTIVRGPLAGVTGVLVEVRHAQRLILSVNLLRRSVLVDVHPDWVTPLAAEPLAGCSLHRL